MELFRRRAGAFSLIASPLLILTFWITYPAYGELAGDGVIRAVDGHPGTTTGSDVLALLGALLAVTASLALMRVLRPSTPRLADVGGIFSIVGWIAVAILVMTDVTAVEIAQQGPTDESVQLFKNVLTNPIVIALNVAASLHLVGGILIGIALLRSMLIPRTLAIGVILASPIHLAANLAGVLWLDSITWVVVATAYAFVIPAVLKEVPGTAGDHCRLPACRDHRLATT